MYVDTPQGMLPGEEHLRSQLPFNFVTRSPLRRALANATSAASHVQ
jgi:hypothetical protein